MSETSVEFHTVSHTAWETMLEDIKRAEQSIDMEQYIFALDEIGKKFLDAMLERAAAGVRVRLLLDTVGSFGFYRTGIAEYLLERGVEVRFYNPVSGWRIANFTTNFFRNHRKSLVIDGKIGHVGGVNVGSYMRDWRDTHVRIMGEVVPLITNTFDYLWDNLKKKIILKIRKPRYPVRHYELLTNAPGFGQRFVYQALIANIRNARSYVYLTSPYFIPDIKLFRVLRLAAKRGVDVRLLVPSVSDVMFVSYARESYYTRALEAGVKIYKYKNVMMHAKAAVIDDVWATTGSYNLDNLSRLFNHELNVASTDPVFVHRLKQHFTDDIQNSDVVRYQEWIHRSLFRKCVELLTWPFHGIM